LEEWQLAYEKLMTREAVKAVLINKKRDQSRRDEKKKIGI
jgi:hypothetical protein